MRVDAVPRTRFVITGRQTQEHPGPEGGTIRAPRRGGTYKLDFPGAARSVRAIPGCFSASGAVNYAVMPKGSGQCGIGHDFARLQFAWPSDPRPLPRRSRRGGGVANPAVFRG